MTRRGLLLALLATPAAAHIHPEQGSRLTPHNEWLNRQVAIDGMKCCDEHDTEILADFRWRMVGGRYEVEIDGAWVPIPPGRVMRPNPADPTPYQEALLFRTGPSIWCFMPAPLY